jgi:enoyl-CoA hydratase/3-hydroxyacyl-CoA dehydrogenase
MTYELFGRKISKIGVVGSGNIGPDIALYFSKVGHRQGVPVVVTDVLQAAIDSGRDKTSKKIQKGVETGAFKPDEARSMLDNITFTVEKKSLAGCDLVIEAATERLNVKQSIVADLEALCPPNAILASNSSHMEPEVIFEKAQRPERCLVIHYFFPAERNPLVEVVPGAKTSPEVADFCMKFYETIGKVPVKVKSRYGYAVDPIFEGLFQAAALCAQDGLASPKQIDAIAQKALGLGVGPFTAMNLTGGNPLTQVGLNHYHEKIFKWFKSPKIMDDQVASGKPWEAAGKGEQVGYTDEQYKKVSARLMAAYFAIAGNVIDAGLVGIGDLELAVELGLVMTPPFKLMNQIGTDQALKLIGPEFPVPECLQRQAGKPWRIPFVLREPIGDVAVLTIKRPRNLNALNVEVMEQLREAFEEIKKDSTIKAAVITGFGVKAFVSGADIDMLANVKTPEDGIATSKKFQDILIGLENLGKPVVCAMNGLAFGGGLEMAMACTTRIARPNLKPFAAQSEVKLGIIPGAGGTQRLPRLIGFERAARMLRLGDPITSNEAKEWGLVYRLVDGDMVAEGVRLARDIASGKEKVPAMPRGSMAAPKLPELNLGTLSKKIDEILCRAIVEGAKMPLEKGLELETRLWGEVCKTQDMRIGLENFKKTALRQPAPFVHA